MVLVLFFIYFVFISLQARMRNRRVVRFESILTRRARVRVLWPVHLLGRQPAFSSKARCLRVSKTDSYGLSRICFEMTRQATMPSVDEQHINLLSVWPQNRPKQLTTANCAS
jgi:hypothetical protein